MKRVVIDAYNFVGLRGGSGGSGSYVLSLIEHLARSIEVRVIASEGNARLFNGMSERAKRLSVHVGDSGHAEAIRIATEDADILYAPFTSLPERASYSHLPAVTAIHDLQHRVLTSIFPEPERIERDDAYFAAAAVADGIITFSATERDHIIQTYNISGPIGVIPHAPFLAEDIERSGNVELSLDRNPYRAKFGRYVLYPAVNWPHKNHYRLIESFRFLSQVYGLNDVKLVLTGAPCVEPREHFYKALLDQPWAQSRIVELGFVSNVQLFLLMKGAEIMAFPSMYEGFGIPVLEALRLRTPVIASNLQVMQEWFDGCFQPFGDIRNSLTMARDLHQLLTEPERQTALANVGYERSRRFSSKHMAEETLNFLSNVIDESYRARRQHVRPRRDVVQLRRKNPRLLFHILIERPESCSLTRIERTVRLLQSKLVSASVGFVILLPSGVCVPPVLTHEPDNRKASNGRGKRLGKVKRPPMDVGVVPPNALTAEVVQEFVERITNSAANVIFFDDDADGLGRAIRFYVSTQVDAASHCFVRVQELDAVAADEQLIVRSVQAALTQPSDDVDGYYVGPGSWPLVRAPLIQIVHEEPWSLGKALVPASHELILIDRFVRENTADCFGKNWILGLALSARITNPKAKFAYIETELTQRVGHHFALVSGLCEVAQAGGLEPIVGANIDAIVDGMSGGILVDPYFSSFSQAPESHVTPTHFADELLAFINRHQIGASDYVYLHMPIPTLITGVLQIVASSRIEDLPVFLIRICSIDESFRWHDIRETSCIRAISKLGGERRKRIRIFVESLPLQRYFKQATGENLPVLLNPVVRELAVAKLAEDKRARRREQGGPLAFGYFGEAREEKGFHLLPGIVEGLLRRYGPTRIKLLLQVSASPQNDTEIIRSARLRLERLAEANKASGAVLLFGNLGNMASYYAAIADCDAMLMPYDPRAYQIRGSGVALEGLALGVPIIVARDTDMASTFDGAGCIVAEAFSVEAFEVACSSVIERYAEIADQVQDYIRTSPLVQSEGQYLRSLLGYVPEIPPEVPAERPVALWIGNDVLSQGCSAVYAAQRGFLRRHGFEIYNVYVPFPDTNGQLQSDEALEKYLVANSLGWQRGGYDFGCYAWTLNQTDDEERRGLLQEITAHDGSTDRLLRLNSYNICPPGLLRLVENRKIDLVCLNYVHLLPVVEKLDLLGLPGTRVVLESHDIQAYQYAVRGKHAVDEEDKELELSKFSDVDAVVAISAAEYDEIHELNPWVNVHFVLPTIQLDSLKWTPGASYLTPEWLEIWFQRVDLHDVYDLRTPDSLLGFRSWILFYGRLEFPSCRLDPGMNSIALAPHPAFPVAVDGSSVLNMIGSAWDSNPALQAKWPNATKASHAHRTALLKWAREAGNKELGLMSDGSLPPEKLKQPACPSALLEALVMGRPVRWPEQNFRAESIRWMEEYGRIDVIIVGSDHPANVMSIHRFIEDVFKPYLEPAGVTLVLVGRAGGALQLAEAVAGLLVLGEVENLDPLYRLASVVAIPTTTGSGTPIKVLDAFARGLCVSVPKFTDRALGLGAFGFPMTDEPSEFAADILGLLKSAEEREVRIELAKQFASTHLTADVYDAKWEELTGVGPRKQPAAQLDATYILEERTGGGNASDLPLPIAEIRDLAQENVDAD